MNEIFKKMGFVEHVVDIFLEENEILFFVSYVEPCVKNLVLEFYVHYMQAYVQR